MNRKMNKNFYNDDNSINLAIFFSFLIVIFTNDYSVGSVFTNNSAARSGEFYLNISNSFPYASENINYHHAQRFLFPYLIGFLSRISDIDTTIIFSFFSYLVLFLIFLIKIKISQILNLNTVNKLFFFLLFIFNPYILRYFTIYPTMLVDLVFLLSGYVFIFYLLNKKSIFLYISIFLAVSTRQTGILILSIIIFYYFFFDRDKKFSLKNLLIIFFIFLFLTFLSIKYTSYGGYEIFPSSAYMGIIIYLRKNFIFHELITFILLPFISIAPVIIFYFINNIKKKNLHTKNDLILTTLIAIFICAQPFLGGPNWTGKNIVRLVTLSYPFIIYSVFLTIEENKKKNNFFLISLIIITLSLWSFHPTFSKIKIFKNLSLKSFLVYKD